MCPCGCEDEMEGFAAEHGIAALLDHLGLDGLANEVEQLRAKLAESCVERDVLEGALRTIAQQQPEVMLMIRRNGFVFERENIGDVAGNWSHLAFTLYTMICLIDTLARHALEGRTE